MRNLQILKKSIIAVDFYWQIYYNGSVNIYSQPLYAPTTNSEVLLKREG